ncbi:methionine--tRNA ligase [Ereboglobus luteus]|uniref:Methionine--tRNA ligase n=1 Tax=Ereboglobus luteus TaxID=1796921 RepID=A0A2U8E0S6_9BACT|nr:methionine--tRNA ligase [Ereboglobus luteus]AWI08385.1 methionine--tRNA ligase [Ereboglobus luteus]
MSNFYITTAIDYVNGSPHLGHAYEKVLTDVIARFRRQMGDNVFFLTGVDEHGQKVQQSARAKGIAPQQFCDEVSQEFRDLCAKLEISNDDFIRTTEPRHKKVVCEILQKLYDKGEIYKAEYKGFYSTRQEQFLQDKDRNPDGTWPEIFGEVTEITESNYFFKLRQYQDWLVDHLKTHEDFVFPRYRQKQVIEFLKEPLNDLCISRPKERLEWGIPLPFDENFVTYVWFDALTNYYTAVTEKPGFWPANFHVIGKDILVPPHAVYWPIMLKAAGIEPPRSLLVHGWWSINGSKMSKSTGNFVDPVAFADQYGTDALRYFVIREMSVGQDSDFSQTQFLARYNADLANNLGNLVNRTLNMTNRFAGGVIPEADAGASGELETELKTLWEKTRDEVITLNEGFQFHIALERTFSFVTATNAYIEKRAPWKLGKSAEPADQAALKTSLATMAESLRLANALLYAVIPGATAKIRDVIGAKTESNWRDELVWGARLTGNKVAESAILFPRPQTKTS